VSGTARQWRWAFALAAMILLADVVTKELVQSIFAYGERLPLTGFFNLVFVMNPGAAFSFLAGADGWQKPVLIGIGIVAAVVIGFMLVRNPMDRLSAFGLAAILGGALGNVIDRARHGAVVDWIDFHLGGWHWPAFNIADIGITVGAAALILASMFVSPRKDAPQGEPR
jgi:signal peptidase II